MNRRHPVRLFFEDVSAGFEPSPGEVDAVAKAVVDGTEGSGLTFATLRRRLRDESKKIIDLRREGSSGEGRTRGREATGELLAEVGDYTPPPRILPDDPRGLAALIPRH